MRPMWSAYVPARGRRAGFGVTRSMRTVTTGIGGDIPLRSENLMCRGLATLVARHYPAEHLCSRFRLTPEQLDRAATAPAFSQAFMPLGEWRWHRVDLPDEADSAEGWLSELNDSAAA